MIARKHKISIAVGFLLLIGIGAYFVWTFIETKKALTEEVYLARKFQMDFVCDEIDSFVQASQNWSTNDYYRKVLQNIAYKLDVAEGAYAELFDENLFGISRRNYFFAERPFDPRKYVEFMDAIKTEDSGELVLNYKPLKSKAHDLFIYYRWIPTDNTQKQRLLLVLGISEYSIKSSGKVPLALSYAALLIFNTICLFIIIFLQRKIGNGGT